MPDEDRRVEIREAIEVCREVSAYLSRRTSEENEHQPSETLAAELDGKLTAYVTDTLADLLDRLEGEREPVAWMFNTLEHAPDLPPDVVYFGRDPGRVERLRERGYALTPLYRLRPDQESADPPPQEET